MLEPTTQQLSSPPISVFSIDPVNQRAIFASNQRELLPVVLIHGLIAGGSCDFHPISGC